MPDGEERSLFEALPAVNVLSNAHPEAIREKERKKKIGSNLENIRVFFL
jgi:hypothetical protein